METHTTPEDNVYIKGNACLFYNLSHRQCHSRYPFLAPITDIPKYRQLIIDQFMHEMETDPPVMILNQTSWLTDIDWIVHEEVPGFYEFLEKNYTKTETFENFDCYLKKE
jgi:hypothetical protein